MSACTNIDTTIVPETIVGITKFASIGLVEPNPLSKKKYPMLPKPAQIPEAAAKKYALRVSLNVKPLFADISTKTRSETVSALA